MTELGLMEIMNEILGSHQQIVPIGNNKLPDEDLAPKNSVILSSEKKEIEMEDDDSLPSVPEKTTDDYMFQFYLGSMTVVGLFILFRMIQKSK